jgi:membrane protein YqaA with SNARE-associated domain
MYCRHPAWLRENIVLQLYERASPCGILVKNLLPGGDFVAACSGSLKANWCVLCAAFFVLRVNWYVVTRN